MDNVIKLGLEKTKILMYVPLLLIFSFGSGLAHGSLTNKPDSKNCQFVAINGSSNSIPLRGELLFSFDKYIILRESEHQELTFLPSDKVVSIRTPVTLPSLSTAPAFAAK